MRKIRAFVLVTLVLGCTTPSPRFVPTPRAPASETRGTQDTDVASVSSPDETHIIVAYEDYVDFYVPPGEFPERVSTDGRASLTHFGDRVIVEDRGRLRIYSMAGQQQGKKINFFNAEWEHAEIGDRVIVCCEDRLYFYAADGSPVCDIHCRGTPDLVALGGRIAVVDDRRITMVDLDCEEQASVEHMADQPRQVIPTESYIVLIRQEGQEHRVLVYDHTPELLGYFMSDGAPEIWESAGWLVVSDNQEMNAYTCSGGYECEEGGQTIEFGTDDQILVVP